MKRYVLDGRTTTTHFPGIGRYVFNLSRALVPQLSHDEQLIVLYNASQPTYWDLKFLSHERIILRNVPVSPFSFRQQWVLPRVLHQLNATVYHSPYYLMPYFSGVSTVVTIHDFIPLRYPQYVSFRARWLFRMTNYLALRTASYTITGSETTRADLVRYYPKQQKHSTVIPHAADPNFHPQSEACIASMRQRYQLPQQYVLYVGSNKPHKNLLRLVEAWDAVSNRDWPLIIAGIWDSRYPEARERISALRLNDIRFLGPVDERDLPALYSGALFFIFPSEYEGFGLPVLEAMACGTPVLCSHTSSLSEIVSNAALVVSPTDVSAIANALEQMLHHSHLRADLRERGLLQASRFSWAQTAQRTLQVYRNQSK